MPDAGIVARKHIRQQTYGTAAIIACLDGMSQDKIIHGEYLDMERVKDRDPRKYSEFNDPKKALRALRKDIAPFTVNQEQTIRRAREMIKQGTVTLDELKELRELTEFWNDYSKYWD